MTVIILVFPFEQSYTDTTTDGLVMIKTLNTALMTGTHKRGAHTLSTSHIVFIVRL